MAKILDRHTPAQIAVEKLAKLAGQGVAPHRMEGATLDILADWRSRQVEPDEMKERMAALHSNIEASVQVAQRYVATAESKTAKQAAAKQLEALAAVATILADELVRCA